VSSPIESVRATTNRFVAALHHRDYRILWMATLSEGAAAWALIIARGWLVYTLSGSSLWVGVTTFAAMGPMFIMPPVAGYLADRMDRRALLAWVFAAQLAHNLALVALALTGAIEVWHLIGLSVVNGAARATQMPAAQALLPNLVPPKDLLNAVALNSATMQGSRLVGPGLIAPLMATVGAGGAFVLCTLFYAMGLFLILRIRTRSTGQMAADKGAAENFFAGLVYVYRHPVVLPLFVVVFLHCCLTMSFESLLPVVSERQLGAGGLGATYLMMGVGAGALIGVIVIAGVQSPRTRGRLLLATAFASGLAPVALALSTDPRMAMLATAGMGATQAGFMTISATIIQPIVPDAIRGRVMSVYLWHIGGMMASFNLMNGALADAVGAPLLLSIAGLAFTAIVPISLLRVPLRRLYVRGMVAAEAQAV
jgi:MFS family permease